MSSGSRRPSVSARDCIDRFIHIPSGLLDEMLAEAVEVSFRTFRKVDGNGETAKIFSAVVSSFETAFRDHRFHVAMCAATTRTSTFYRPRAS